MPELHERLMETVCAEATEQSPAKAKANKVVFMVLQKQSTSRGQDKAQQPTKVIA